MVSLAAKRLTGGKDFAMTKAYVLINSEVVYTKDVMEGLRKLDGLVEVHEVLGRMTLWRR